MLKAIDGRDFWTASPPSLGKRIQERGLYQAEINGFVSALLVLIRLLASCSSSLLIWRLIYILLEKSGLTIAELCRMANQKIPITPHLGSRSQFSWSSFAIIVTVLLWPPFVAAPLANSSLNWIPSTRSNALPSQSYKISTFINTTDDLNGFMYAHIIMPSVLRASLMVSQECDYAFLALKESQIPLRRYIYGASPYINESGEGKMVLPYFKVENITWLDAPDGVDLSNLDNASMLSQSITPGLHRVGTVGFLKETKWKFDEAIPSYKASQFNTFEGRKNISIFASGVGVDERLEDGSTPTEQTPCPKHGYILANMPPVKAFEVQLYVGSEWRAKRCYLLAEVSIKAGAYPDRRTNITQIGSSNKMNMAVPLDPTDAEPVLSPDGSILPVLDMMSDVARLMTDMDLTPQWQKDNTIDNYVAGMLTTAYHATWSAMPMANNNETISMVPVELVIRARISRTRLYIWLVMNSTLAVAAIITAAASCMAVKANMVRNTTLAAITLGLGHVAHTSNSGLCNAADLNKDDHALGRMRWRDHTGFEESCLAEESYGDGCCKDLGFVHGKT